MEIDAKTPLILGRPFLSTAEASIDVGAGEVHLNINGMRETFSFRPKVEQCSQVKIFKCQKYVPKPPIYDASGKEMDSLVAFMKRKLATEAAIRQREKDEWKKARAMKANRKNQETGGKAPVKKVGTHDFTRPINRGCNKNQHTHGETRTNTMGHVDDKRAQDLSTTNSNWLAKVPLTSPYIRSRDIPKGVNGSLPPRGKPRIILRRHIYFR